MRTIVCGGREYRDYRQLSEVMNRLRDENGITLLIHGDCGRVNSRGIPVEGADKLAGRWAAEAGVQSVAVPANWTAHGKSAGMRRNHFMAQFFSPELVIAFPGGRGTANMMRIARDMHVELIDVEDIL